MNSDILSPLTSLLMLGRIIDNPSYWPAVLTGDWDEQLRPGLYYHEHSTAAADEHVLANDQACCRALDNLKKWIRHMVSQTMKESARREAVLQRQAKSMAFQQVASNFQQMHAQAPEGTVRELAERYQVPIAQIRKLKAENRLSELPQIAKLAPDNADMKTS